MRLSDVRELVRLQRPEFDSTRRLLRGCHNIADLRAAARRRVPRGVFDYIDGGADDEATSAANRASFERYEFQPRCLRDVSKVDTNTQLLGKQMSLPFALAPVGYLRMMHNEGEFAAARAAAAAGIPHTLSTMGTRSVEQVARIDAHDRWFQLYIWRDRELSARLVDRAAAAGYRTLVVTVDTAVPSLRERDARNGFTIPPQLTLRTLADIGMHPRWWSRTLAGDAITFANVDGDAVRTSGPNTNEFVTSQFDPSVTWDDLAGLRERWNGPMLIKGVVTVDDARRAAELGLDGIVLSNHGGRQLDHMAAPMDVLPEIRDAVGDSLELLLDSGVRRGSDIVKALALGANGCLIGRAYAYGLAAAGQDGVGHAIGLLESQLRRTMQLLGVTSIAELREHGRGLVRRKR